MWRFYSFHQKKTFCWFENLNYFLLKNFFLVFYSVVWIYANFSHPNQRMSLFMKKVTFISDRSLRQPLKFSGSARYDVHILCELRFDGPLRYLFSRIYCWCESENLATRTQNETRNYLLFCKAISAQREEQWERPKNAYSLKCHI